MTDLLPCVEVEPRAPQEGSVILMHGLGANGHDFEPVVPMMQLPQVRFVFPNAPSIPVTINGGIVMPAWYDILTLERTGIRENGEQIVASAARIRALIEREEARGIPSERIVLAGFSQGAAMALYTGLRYDKTLGGILVLSGYPVLPDRLVKEATEANRSTPVLFCHGRHDPVVPMQFGRVGYEMVSGWSKGTVDWAEFPIAHHVSEPELHRIGVWLRDRFRTQT